MKYFETRFLAEANEFLSTLDKKTVRKVLYNIALAEQVSDPKLFKKLTSEIWEFRTRIGVIQVRLLAFWDKSLNTETLVIATHGFIKKVDKVPGREIDRARKLRREYFENK